MKRHAVAAATIVVAALAVFGPALRYGEVFNFRDHADYFQPLRFYTAQHLRAGRLPLWNPYNASGEPWLANPQTAVFYPPAWVFLVVPFAYAYTLYLLLHALLLGTGTYVLCASEESRSRAAALLGAVALMLSGPVLSLLDVQNNFTTFAWVPWILWRARRDREHPRPLVAGALLALAFLAGEPFYAAITAALYAVVVRRPRVVARAGGFAVALSAVQLFPFVEMLAGSNRTGGFDVRDILRASMPLRDWTLLAIPPRFARASAQHFISVPYAGAFVVVLAVAGALVLAVRREWPRLAASLGGIAVVAVVASGPAWIAKLPLTLFRYPARVVPFAVLALVLLAVAGWDALRRRSVVVDAVLIAAIALDLLAATATVRTIAPFRRERVPYDAAIGRDRKVLQAYRDVTLGGSSRAAWMSGYLNLLDLRFAALTAAPVTSRRYLDLYYDALVHVSTLRNIGTGWVLSQAALPPPFIRVARAERVNVYRVDGALPMAYVLSPGGLTTPVRTLALDASRATAHVVTARPGMLVLTQNDAPGWHVRVDGREAKPQLAFGTFRAVAIDAGTHDVEWRYRPISIAVGAVVTFLALLFGAAFVKRVAHENFFGGALKSTGNRGEAEV
jgi:hypothetical protein